MTKIFQTDTALNPPIVLAIGGHDPGGGAGIQADIETIAALGVHALTLVTALTVQDSRALRSYEPVSASLILEQFEMLAADSKIDVVKLGLIGSEQVMDAVLRILRDCPDATVVCDPVLAAGGGGSFSSESLMTRMIDDLLPLCDLLTPNSIEARQLARQQEPEDCARQLIDYGVPNLLITGGHEDGELITNRYYDADGEVQSWDWPRLPGEYHGTGCTLASAIAALLARELPMKMALGMAQGFVAESLVHARRTGLGQLVPGRIIAVS